MHLLKIKKRHFGGNKRFHTPVPGQSDSAVNDGCYEKCALFNCHTSMLLFYR